MSSAPFVWQGQAMCVVWQGQAMCVVWQGQAMCVVWQGQAMCFVWQGQAMCVVWQAQAMCVVWQGQAMCVVWQGQAMCVVWQGQAMCVDLRSDHGVNHVLRSRYFLQRREFGCLSTNFFQTWHDDRNHETLQFHNRINWPWLSFKVTGIQENYNLHNHHVVKWPGMAQTFAMVDYVIRVTAKMSCKCGGYRLRICSYHF